ncbi:MAG: hypothetical protein Q8P51_13270 [Ignavibacteria bacterium]|nr:hypothetical protein [Ignavibacteria bacterium]
MPNDNQSPPDDLKLKEPDDSKFVTEELAKMQPIIHRLLAGWFILVGVFAIVTILQTWPPGGQQTTPASSVSTKTDTTSVIDTSRGVAPREAVSTSRGTPTPEQRYLLVALLFGMLGGASHGLASLMDFRGQRRLFRSWSLWYFALPFLGGMMAVIFYVVIRAGLLTGTGETATDLINPYGVAAISAVVGLFTDQATNKLGEVFKTLFATKGAARGGQLGQNAPPEDERKP